MSRIFCSIIIRKHVSARPDNTGRYLYGLRTRILNKARLLCYGNSVKAVSSSGSPFSVVSYAKLEYLEPIAQMDERGEMLHAWFFIVSASIAKRYFRFYCNVKKTPFKSINIREKLWLYHNIYWERKKLIISSLRTECSLFVKSWVSLTQGCFLPRLTEIGRVVL